MRREANFVVYGLAEAVVKQVIDYIHKIITLIRVLYSIFLELWLYIFHELIKIETFVKKEFVVSTS